MSVSKDKNELREIYREKRRKIADRKEAEKAILEKVLSSDEYLGCSSVFTYVSVKTEADTKELIRKSLENGKKVAVPVCNDSDFTMEFFYIESPEDLSSVSSFGTPEANAECQKAEDDEKTLCIVPALSFDRNGFRLGYGKGFYDRYLKNFKGKTIGLCFEECLGKTLPKSSDDMKVSKVITQNQVIITDKGE